jgi:hypothetical protein
MLYCSFTLQSKLCNQAYKGETMNYLSKVSKKKTLQDDIRFIEWCFVGVFALLAIVQLIK